MNGEVRVSKSNFSSNSNKKLKSHSFSDINDEYIYHNIH